MPPEEQPKLRMAPPESPEEIARRLKRDERAVIVTVFPDSGEKYLSERFWSEE